MIKIKFNMDFRGEYIRNLEDLRNNFSIEDILEAYDNGLLVRWLDARYYTNELKQVRAIETTNARGVLEELIRIFCPETEQEEIDANLSLYDYLEGLRKFRDYITTNGLYELGTIRQERDKLTQELEEVKKERDELRKEIKNAKEENQEEKQIVEATPKASSSNIKRVDIPAGSLGVLNRAGLSWTDIPAPERKYRIIYAGNCKDKLWVTDDVLYSTVSDACSRKMQFTKFKIQASASYDNDEGLYFYYEVI